MASFDFSFLNQCRLSSLSKLKASPSFCFPFKIPDDPTETNMCTLKILTQIRMLKIKIYYIYYIDFSNLHLSVFMRYGADINHHFQNT